MSADAWGIPTLDPARQLLRLVPPVVPYGTVPRGAEMRGTYHFYVHDSKFTRLFANPARLLRSGCVAAFEPNCSTGGLVTRAEALYGILRKRTAARFWQDAGLDVCVDLSVDAGALDLALLGVPEGWRSYAARSHRKDGPDTLATFYGVARRHAGADPFFVVVGGGARVRAECAAKGWHYVPEHCRVARGEVGAYGSERLDGGRRG